MGRREPRGRVPEPIQIELPNVVVVHGEHATVAVVDFDGESFVGEAKRHPGDVRDYGIGRDLALGRALQRYGQHLVSTALREAGVGEPDPEPQMDLVQSWVQAFKESFRNADLF